MLTMNLLQALPRTPLWRRLEAAGRLRDETPDRDSNVEYLFPYETVLESWRACMTRAYAPDALFTRFDYQLEQTFPHRKRVRRGRAALRPRALRHGVRIFAGIIWHMGIRADYRRRFWRTAWRALRARDVQALFEISLMAYHLIRFARDAVHGQVRSSMYDRRPEGFAAADRWRPAADAAAAPVPPSSAHAS
jgi:hypothetical protein